MGLLIQEIGLKANSKAKEGSFSRTVIFIKVSGNQVKCTGEEFSLKSTDQEKKECGSTENLLKIQTDININIFKNHINNC